jgi:metal transporter CNNM
MVLLIILGLVVLLILSGLFSGLNLGLMSIDLQFLAVVGESGVGEAKKYARALLPLRNRGNWLLTTILTGNTAVNVVIAVLLASLFDSVLGTIISTLGILIFGEIIPQAVCTRHGLKISYHARWFLTSWLVLLAPLTWPIAKLLDVALGREVGNVYSREELLQLLDYHVRSSQSDLDRADLRLLKGSLLFAKKRVVEILTPAEQVFALPTDAFVDASLLARIRAHGYS